MTKARYFRYSPDEYLTGIRKLNATEQGVYWLCCTLMYSENGPIEEDYEDLAGLAKLRIDHTKRILQRLISMGKIERFVDADGVAKLSCPRVEREVSASCKRALTAAENGRNGGRPPSKSAENLGSENQPGFSDGKLTTNYKPLTTNQEKNPPTQPPLGGGDDEDLFQAEQAPKARAPRSRGRTTMKTDWRPSQTAQDQCAAMGLDVEQVIEDVRDYWLSNGKRMVDWDAVFRRRCKDLRVRKKASLRLVHQRDDQVML